jgi:hypothetical protein
MPSIRVGFGSDYVIKNQSIGIGTDNPRATLDVVGSLKGDISVSGVNTLSLYAGFVPEIQNINENLTLTGEFNSPSEDIVVGAGVTFVVSDGSTFSVGSLESISVQSHFSVPDGGTLERPADPVEGMVRFNDDLNTLEFWNGFEWRQFTVTGASGRGVFGGGITPTIVSTIDYINLSTGGSSINFGVLTTGRRFAGGCSSSTRGIFGGGITPAATNVIDYVTITSSGNAIDFGDLTVARGTFGASSSTRALFFGGGNIVSNVIDYIQINTLGNALDFGDMITSIDRNSTCASPIRAITAGGGNAGLNTIEFVTIASTGNSVFFGNLSQKMGSQSGCSNSIRGIFSGGYNSPSGPYGNNTIEYITIASAGNALDFGDLTYATKGGASCATSTRAIFAGGYNPTTTPYPTKIDFVTISSLGNAQNFGDLTLGRQQFSGISDSHGGLGGF